MEDIHRFCIVWICGLCFQPVQTSKYKMDLMNNNFLLVIEVLVLLVGNILEVKDAGDISCGVSSDL